jgi:hypothetical protein
LWALVRYAARPLRMPDTRSLTVGLRRDRACPSRGAADRGGLGARVGRAGRPREMPDAWSETIRFERRRAGAVRHAARGHRQRTGIRRAARPLRVPDARWQASGLRAHDARACSGVATNPRRENLWAGVVTGLIPPDATELGDRILQGREGVVEKRRVPSRRVDRATEVRPHGSQVVIQLEPGEAEQRVPHDGSSESDRAARVVGGPTRVRDPDSPTRSAGAPVTRFQVRHVEVEPKVDDRHRRNRPGRKSCQEPDQRRSGLVRIRLGDSLLTGCRLANRCRAGSAHRAVPSSLRVNDDRSVGVGAGGCRRAEKEQTNEGGQHSRHCGPPAWGWTANTRHRLCDTPHDDHPFLVAIEAHRG